jgi:hypothetical protein
VSTHYRLVARVSMVAITYVEAENIEQAKKIAARRNIGAVCFRCGGDADRHWILNGDSWEPPAFLEGAPK